MIFQLLIGALLAQTGIYAGETDQTTVSPVPQVQGGMCEVCSCKEDIVDCSNKKLEDHFEDEHWPKETMREVSFANNSFVHVKAFPKADVRKLILCHNRISSIDDAAFIELTNLTELDLSHNELTTPRLGPHIFQGKFSPEAYNPMGKMKILDLGYNALHSLHQDLFEHLGSLTYLSLEGNPLSVIDSSTLLAISNLAYLEDLDLSYCELDDLPEHIFHTPKFLRNVDLSGNKFTSPPLALEDGKSIEWVSLDENPIKVINEENAFPIMLKLKELSMCCMPNLTRIGARGLSELRQLEVLHIEGCPLFEDIDENALARGEFSTEWPPLKKLQLADNALRYLPAGLVSRWDTLEELDLTNNRWSCDCKNQYLVESLIPGLGRQLMGENVSTLTCSAPPEHLGKNLTSLENRHLRCLDLYNARPEKDATVLVGLLIGVLLAVPVTLLGFVFWRRGYFFCGSQNPGTFSRAFYKRADANDEF